MKGMDVATGKAIDGRAHLKQRVHNLLSTPLGSRVMRRDYGSLLPRLVDRPMNASLKLDAVFAVVDAISKWEPELYTDQVIVSQAAPNQLMIDVNGRYAQSGIPVTLLGLVI